MVTVNFEGAFSFYPHTPDRAAAQALLEERLELALRAALGDGEAVSTAFSAAVSRCSCVRR